MGGLRLRFFLLCLIAQELLCLIHARFAPSSQPPSPSSQASSPAKSSVTGTQRILIIGFAAFLAAFTLASILFLRNKEKLRHHFGYSDRKSLSEVRQFPYNELKRATEGFSEGRCLGRGGFSTVFAGILQDGTMVAIKLLNCSIKQASPQFMSEIEILSKFDHPNLVRLIGCSLDGEALALVYEFVNNGNLFDHLHNNKTKLPWLSRINIAISMAQVLAILHSNSILHRDFKSGNILLDELHCPKLGDFGLSKSSSDSPAFTEAQGTAGYLDPDYYNCYQLTDKSDVYSFGVVLMELITGQAAIIFTKEGKPVNLACHCLGMIQSGLFEQIVDPSLETSRNRNVRQMVLQVAELAFRCLAVNREDRPCMTDVAASLTSISVSRLTEKMNFLSSIPDVSVLFDEGKNQRPCF